MGGCKGDISTLHTWGHFYFALTSLAVDFDTTVLVT
jgi:hypothetical protein